MQGQRGRASSAAAAVAVLLAANAPARSEQQAPRLRVEFQGRLLTVAADDAPLGAVLRAVGEAAAIEVPVIDSRETFSGTFSALPLPEALDWLLGGRSYVLRYDAGGDPERLVLWLDRAGGSAPAMPAAPATPAPAARAASSAQEETWIRQRLGSPDRGTRIVAVRRLQRLPPDRAAALGMRVLQAESDPVVRGQLAAALGRVGGDEAVRVLAALLDDQDPSVRIAAARALGGVAGDAATQLLGRTLLDGTDPALRQAALESLASRPQDSAREYLRRAADRAADPMADAARRALSGELVPPAATAVDQARPCLHAAARQKGCLRK